MLTKKFRTGLAVAALSMGLCLGMTGCGENMIPELTESEMQTIGEYAAFTLMKYDASNRSRLVELPSEPVPEIPEQTEPEKPLEPENPSETGPVDNTPVTDMTEPEDPGSMEDVLGLTEGVNVSFADAEICDKYPHEDEIGGLSVSASSGKKLLVLHFQFINNTEQEQFVDIASQKELSFRITVNGDYRRNAMTVLLLDDMTALRETIPAGGITEAVLIIEVEQESIEDVASISLNLKNDVKAYTIQLK